MFFGSHFEHLLAIFVVLLVRAKGQNTVIYNVSVPLLWKKYFLQQVENWINTSVFATH